MSTHSKYRRSQQPVTSWSNAILAISLFAAVALGGFFVLLYASERISPAFALINVAVLVAFIFKRNRET